MKHFNGSRDLSAATAVEAAPMLREYRKLQREIRDLEQRSKGDSRFPIGSLERQHLDELQSNLAQRKSRRDELTGQIADLLYAATQSSAVGSDLPKN